MDVVKTRDGARLGWTSKALVEMECLYSFLNMHTEQRAPDNPEDSSIRVVSNEHAGSDTQ